MFFRQRTRSDASMSCFFGCSGRGRSIAVDEAQRAFNTGTGR